MNILKKTRAKYGPYIRWKKDLIRELKAGSRVIETERGPVEYAIHGESGPFVSVMHGGPGGYDQTEALFSELYGKGFRILSWSRPGYVRTPLDTGRTFEEQSYAFTALIDALGIDRTALFAYSAGGPVAVGFAAHSPDRVWALILECAVSQRYKINRNNIGEQILFGHLMFNGPSLWLADVAAHHAPMLVGWATIEMESSLEEDDVIRLMKDIMKDEQRVKILMDLIRGMSPPRLRTKGLNNDIKQLAKIDGLPFEHIAAPTLVIHGTNDLDVPLEHAQTAAGKIPGAEIYLVEGGFHILALSDAAEEVQEKKILFLKSHAPQSPLF
jgi:pimeloyl-ACP methyl ester carboxylesterase